MKDSSNKKSQRKASISCQANDVSIRKVDVSVADCKVKSVQ